MAYTGCSKSSDPGSLYTQFFKTRAGSWSIAYTVYAKSQDPGRLLVDSVYSIRKKSGPGQILGRWRIQDARKAQIREACILNFSRLRQIPSRQRIQDARKAQIRGACILNFSRPGQAPGRWRIQYTQKVRTRAGSWSMAYTGCSKGQNPDSSQGNLYTQKS